MALMVAAVPGDGTSPAVPAALSASERRDRSLGRLARFAAGFAGGRRVTIREARTEADLEDTRRLRHDIYCREKGYLCADQLLDQFDRRATILNVYLGDEAVATLRLIDQRQATLELEETHPEIVALLPAGKRYIEASRLMVRREHRGFRVTLPLFKHFFRRALDSGADGVLITCAAHLIPYYARFGFRQLNDRPLVRAGVRNVKDHAMVLDFVDEFERLNLMKLVFVLAIDVWHGRRSVAYRWWRGRREARG